MERAASAIPVSRDGSDGQGPTERFAGWIGAGMLDWPGKVAATVFLAGCSLRCPYCHNPALLSVGGAGGDWAGFAAHARERRSWLDGVVVTGGEPTEDPDLFALLAELSELGYGVKLDTNGTRPDVLEAVLRDRLVEYVALDVKTLPDRYRTVAPVPETAARVAASAQLLIDSGIDHEFRTTAFPGTVALEELPEIARSLRGGRLFAIQQFRSGATLAPEAGSVEPFTSTQLRAAARDCHAFLPTIVRGAA
jgi:pyruvate formate lyase activating enzyme